MPKALRVGRTRVSSKRAALNNSSYLGHGTLPRLAEVQQHHHVEHGEARVRLARDSKHLDDEQAVRVAHRVAAAPEDGAALFVRPVVQDLAERPHLAGGGNRMEEASTDELASIPHTALRQKPVRIGEDLGLLDEHAADPGMLLESSGQQGTGASADIHDCAHAGPVGTAAAIC